MSMWIRLHIRMPGLPRTPPMLVQMRGCPAQQPGLSTMPQRSRLWAGKSETSSIPQKSFRTSAWRPVQRTSTATTRATKPTVIECPFVLVWTTRYSNEQAFRIYLAGCVPVGESPVRRWQTGWSWMPVSRLYSFIFFSSFQWSKNIKLLKIIKVNIFFQRPRHPRWMRNDLPSWLSELFIRVRIGVLR